MNVSNCLSERRASTHSSQHGRYELVGLIRLHEVAHLQHADSQSWDDSRMLLQGLFQHFAVAVVVFDSPDFGDAPKALEGLEVRLIDVGEVWVRHDNVWQSLDIAQAVRKSGLLSKSSRHEAGRAYHLVGSSNRQ